MSEPIKKESVEELASLIEKDEKVLSYLVDSITSFMLNWDVMSSEQKRSAAYDVLVEYSAVGGKLTVIYSDYDSSYAGIKPFIDKLNEKLNALKEKKQ